MCNLCSKFQNYLLGLIKITGVFRKVTKIFRKSWCFQNIPFFQILTNISLIKKNLQNSKVIILNLLKRKGLSSQRIMNYLKVICRFSSKKIPPFQTLNFRQKNVKSHSISFSVPGVTMSRKNGTKQLTTLGFIARKILLKIVVKMGDRGARKFYEIPLDHNPWISRTFFQFKKSLRFFILFYFL